MCCCLTSSFPLCSDAPFLLVAAAQPPNAFAPCFTAKAAGRDRRSDEIRCVLSHFQPARFDSVAFKGDLDRNLAKSRGGGTTASSWPSVIRGPWIEALAGVAAHRLAVPAIGTGQAWGEERLSYSDPDPVVRRAAIERTKAHIPVAHRLDALIIIGLLRGIVQPGLSHAQALGWTIDALTECCAEAAKSGVRLAVKPINRYETTLINNVSQGLELIDRVGADNLGLLFDTFHANIEEPSIEESLVAAGGRLFHVHVADSNRWFPGAGHLDFAHSRRTGPHEDLQGLRLG